MSSICTQGQIDSVYFDLSSASDIVPHNILPHKLSNFGLSSSYVDWFHSYLVNRHSSVHISGMLLFFFLVKSGVPKGSTIGPLLFNIFINDICNSVHNCRYLLFADDLKIYLAIISVDHCKLLQMILIQCIIGVWLMV
jgi:sarcosine oxidase/L-pipecolate oxidase